MNNRFYSLAVAGTALFASSAHATLLSGFEAGIDGWSGTTTATLAQSTIGATEGTHSLAINYSGFNWIQSAGAASQANANALNASTTKKIAFDVTIVNPVGNWINSIVSFNDAGNWRQTAQVDFSAAAGTKTVTLDYSTLLAPNYTAGNWFQLHLSVNSETASTIYIDNVRTVEAVPEPMSIAALGLGVAAFVRKRRTGR